MNKTVLHWLQYIFILPILFFSLFITSWTASYLTISEDWKEHLVFTPKTAEGSNQIYKIDKLLYAFKYSPVFTTIFVLSIIYLIGIMITRYLYYRKYKTGFIGLQLMIVLPIFLYTLLVTHSIGTMIAVEKNWEKYLVFSPASITDVNQIHYIDKLLYTLQKSPTSCIIFILSFLYIIGLIVFKIFTQMRFHKRINTWGDTHPSRDFYFCYFTIIIYCFGNLTLSVEMVFCCYFFCYSTYFSLLYLDGIHVKSPSISMLGCFIGPSIPFSLML